MSVFALMDHNMRDASRAVCDGLESCVFTNREDECQETVGSRVLIPSYDRPFIVRYPCDLAQLRVYDPSTPMPWTQTHVSAFNNETCVPFVGPQPGKMAVVFDSFGVLRPVPQFKTFFNRVSVRGSWKNTYMIVYAELLRNDACCAFPTVFFGLNNATCVMTARESTCGQVDAAEYACVVTSPTLRTQINLTHAAYTFGVIPIDESCGSMLLNNRLVDAFGADLIRFDPSLEWFASQPQTVLSYADFVVVMSVCVPIAFALIWRLCVFTTQYARSRDVRKAGMQVVRKSQRSFTGKGN